MKLCDAAEEHMLLLPRDFIQACWLFKLLNKNRPVDEAQEMAVDLEKVNVPAEEGLPEGIFAYHDSHATRAHSVCSKICHEDHGR